VSNPPVNNETLDQMYQDAVVGCRAVWNAINDVRKSGCQIYVEIHPDRVIVQSLKSMQRVWIDAPSAIDYSSWVPSTVPSEGEINPDSAGMPAMVNIGRPAIPPTNNT
jgi:hypothetical protein